MDTCIRQNKCIYNMEKILTSVDYFSQFLSLEQILSYGYEFFHDTLGLKASAIYYLDDDTYNVFPPYQQQQVRTQLASVLEGIISQQIIPRADGHGRVAAFELLIATPAVRNLIREGKTHQLMTSLETGSKFGMNTMDSALIKLYRDGVIDNENLRKYAVDIDMINKQVGYY